MSAIFKTSRRHFLKTLAICAPIVISRNVLAKDGVPGANDRIGVAGIGIGRQGSGVFLNAARDSLTQAICTCDVYLPRAKSVAEAAKIQNIDENSCQDFRRVLDRKDVDAIVTATPEHWRSLICVNAALAGKHIYAEKPMTLTVSEGRLMVKAARKTNVVFQTGSMQRSMRPNVIGCKFIREGGLGEIKEVIAANYESPWCCGLPEETVPDGLDWEMWCGPTSVVPFNSNLFIPRGNPGWLSFRPYSGGEVTGWGSHGLDQVQWALGLQETGPVEILAEGDALVPPTYTKAESRDRGNKLCSSPHLAFRYANGVTVWLGKENVESNRGGAIFFGTKGKMEIFRNRITTNPPEIAEKLLAESPIRDQNHVHNWLECILNGETPVSDCEFGHRTASLCHILNIARYLGRSLKWDPEKEEFVGDAEANTFLARAHRKGYELPEV